MEGTPPLRVGDDMLCEGMTKIREGMILQEEGMVLLGKVRKMANDQHAEAVHGPK